MLVSVQFGVNIPQLVASSVLRQNWKQEVQHICMKGQKNLFLTPTLNQQIADIPSMQHP
jgi:hypothetical protein